MTVFLSSFGGAGWQFFDANGVPLSGGKIYSYLAGTTTPAPTYTNNTGASLHTNPIILNSAGRVATGEIWQPEGTAYKYVLSSSTDVIIGTFDNIETPDATKIATQAEAEAGVNNTKIMTPLRTEQHMRAQMGEDWSHNAKYYGVVADNATDNTAAMSAYLTLLSQSGMPGFFVGTVYCASNLEWDVGPSWERGVALSGVARLGSRLRFGNAIPTNTPALRIYSSTQPFLPGFSSYDWLGLRMSQVSILANHDGFGLAIGRDDLNGPLNVAVFDQVTVFNTFTGFNSGAWWLKHVVNSVFTMCAGNCFGGVAPPYYGTALRLERVQFTSIVNGSFGNADIGLQFRDFANTVSMDAINSEAVRVCLQTESAPVGELRLRAPRFALANDFCVRLLAGTAADRLTIDSYTTDVPAKFVDPNYGTGLLINDGRGVSTPAFVWDTNVTNNTYKVVVVQILGGTPTGILVNGFDYGASDWARTQTLNPGDVIRVNGSGAAAWTWRPLRG